MSKSCPLRVAANGAHNATQGPGRHLSNECTEDGCAWWIETGVGSHGACAITQLARGLDVAQNPKEG